MSSAARPMTQPSGRIESGQERSELVIVGLTDNGQRFRPSDWAQRLATAAAAGYRRSDNRVRYHPAVRIAVVDGVSAVAIDRHLETSDPMLYEFLLRFAAANRLRMLTR